MQRIALVLVTVLVAALVGLLVGCGPQVSEEVAPGGPERAPGSVLRVGTEAAYPPFESVADDGSLVGLDIDLLRAFGDVRTIDPGVTPGDGFQIEFRNTAFDALVPDLQGGRNDLICSGMSWTAERARIVDFSRPYVSVAMGVLISTDRAGDVTSVAQLESAGRLFSVQRGTSGATKCAERFPRAAADGRIKEYDSEADAAADVAAGRVDAFVYDMVSVAKLHKRNPETTRILDGDLGVEHYCIAVRKGDAALLARLDAFLADARRPGGALEAICARWFDAPERFRVAPDVLATWPPGSASGGASEPATPDPITPEPPK